MRHDIETAIRDAAERIHDQESRRKRREGFPPDLGDLYVFPLKTELAVAWLLVRRHPDDLRTFLAVPADDFPLRSGVDEVFNEDTSGADSIARCGHATWISQATCETIGSRVDHVEGGFTVPAIQDIIAGMARGRLPLCRYDADDPEYERHCELIELATKELDLLDEKAEAP